MGPTEIAVLTARPPSTLRLTTKTTSTLSTTSTPSTTPVNLHFTVPTEEPRTVIPRNVKIMPPPTTPPVIVIKILPRTLKVDLNRLRGFLWVCPLTLKIV